MGTITKPYPVATVAGVNYELKPTLEAVRRITQLSGGIAAAYRKIADLDYDVIAGVIIAGAGLKLKGEDEINAFVSAVWKEYPRTNWHTGLMEYVLLLLNGGVEREEDEPQKDGEPKKVGEGNG